MASVVRKIAGTDMDTDGPYDYVSEPADNLGRGKAP